MISESVKEAESFKTKAKSDIAVPLNYKKAISGMFSCSIICFKHDLLKFDMVTQANSSICLYRVFIWELHTSLQGHWERLPLLKLSYVIIATAGKKNLAFENVLIDL